MNAETPYYKSFEHRKPYVSQKKSAAKTLLFQFFSVGFISIGISYLMWRWFNSLNPAAFWFAIPLAVAETLMFIGSVLMIINYWETKTIPVSPPVAYLSEISSLTNTSANRPLTIDIFIATYNEERAVVEDTIKDAGKLLYPPECIVNIYLCDDGRRDGRDPEKENFKQLAEEYGIKYFVRENNKGFKAGNLNHAFWQTEGDLIVILDADTRVFSKFLIHLTGYFRDKKMAWVQSPQWFYDITSGKKLSETLLGKVIPFSNKITIGKDILGIDSHVFYDVILRNRNAANAAFCCGAGSVHRRAALEQLILSHSKRLKELHSVLPMEQEKIRNKRIQQFYENGMIVGPFVQHISEDIYTSILLHADKWKSYQHPDVECKMLSPQTLPAYIKQHSRYAEGTFQLFFSNENPLIKKGLTLWQRLAYFETIYSYFSPFWLLIFLLSPIVFFFTLTPPIMAFNFDFFLRFLLFNLLNMIIVTLGNWGVSTKRSEQYYIGGFWHKLQAFFKVVSGRKIIFNATAKGIQKETFMQRIKPIIPHYAIAILTFAGFVYNAVLIYQNIHPSYSAFVANSIWSCYNLYQLSPIMRAAFIKL